VAMSYVDASDPSGTMVGGIPTGDPSVLPPLIPFWTDITQSDGSTLAAPPPVDLAQVTPAVADVAILERTRTYHDDLTEVSVFDSDTRPTDVEVQALITQATDEVLGQLPSHVDASWYPAIRRLITLRSAALVEISFYKEQALAAAAVVHTAQYASELQTLQKRIPCLILPLVA
jgi:hypothetical protein